MTKRGHRPAPPANETALLVIGVDGGRVQTNQKNEETPGAPGPA